MCKWAALFSSQTVEVRAECAFRVLPQSRPDRAKADSRKVMPAGFEIAKPN